MLLLAFIAAVATPHEQARVTVRIIRAQRVNKDEWERSRRKREIVLHEGGLQVTVRLIEFE